MVEILEGDVIRTNLSKGLGFSREDRETNLMRIAFVCNLLTRNGVPNIAAAISPFKNVREQARELIGNFVEVYARCPIEQCIDSRPEKTAFASSTFLHRS
jgi:adenylylsulfate kinase-like enzyme